jgi:hypothetical protein
MASASEGIFIILQYLPETWASSELVEEHRRRANGNLFIMLHRLYSASMQAVVSLQV